MPSVGSFALLSSFGMASAAAAAAANPLEPVTDVIDAALGAVQDVSGYVLGSPRTAADIIIWVIEFGRGIPGLAKAVFQGDTATQDKLCNFAVFAAASVFVVYASLVRSRGGNAGAGRVARPPPQSKSARTDPIDRPQPNLPRPPAPPPPRRPPSTSSSSWPAL